VTDHTVGLSGLPECSLQYFSVSSADSLSQTSVADNGGSYFAFLVGADVSRAYPSADPPVPVPAQSATPKVATVVLSDGRPIVDVNVRFHMIHTAAGNNTVSLRHPDGTLVTLSNRRGGFLDNFTDTVFDDEAVVPIASGFAPFTGSFVPDGPLSPLDGKSAAGTWRLEVLDDVAGEAGTITGFELQITVAQLQCGPNCVRESSARLSDECSGGGAGSADGYWDDGEAAAFRVTLRNTGQTGLTGVSATVTPATSGVTMLDDFANYPDIPRDVSADPLAPYFAAHLPSGFACGAPVHFDVSIRTDQGTFTDTVQVGTAGQSIPAGVASPLFERFTAGIPASWTVEDQGTGGGAAGTWTTANPGSRAGAIPISSPFVIVDSQAAGADATQDERLVSPIVDLSAAAQVTLEFDSFFFVAFGGGDERGDVDVRSSLTGGAWVNVFRYAGNSSANPDHRVLDITSQAAGAADVQVRFRYYQAAFDNWWMIDNVKVSYPFGASCVLSSCAQAGPPGEVLRMLWETPSSVSWTAAAAADSYSLYRGADFELPKLYTGEADSCARASTADLSAAGLSESPSAGSFSWWMVRASNANGLGPAGSGSPGPRLHDPLGVCP
jgi:subtilisin-like proprotein convertase family protein